MEDLSVSFNANNSISVSRNSPVALIVGVAGFLGSHLAEKLILENIQVVGIDDFSSGNKRNLEKLIKDRRFHFINQSILDIDPRDDSSSVVLNLGRLDYAFFVVDSPEKRSSLSEGVLHFLHAVRRIRENIFKLENQKESENKKTTKNSRDTLLEKPKLEFVSSINLYNDDLSVEAETLKEAEIKFAKFVKFYKFNARVVRLSTIYGPRMHFRVEDPLVRLIQASLSDQLEEQQTSLDFISRALYIDDAVNLLVKAVLQGSTANKIYDGALLQPVKILEIKQILVDPLWHESRGFRASELPPWPTPNLKKSLKELNWQPKAELVSSLKKTIAYFKEQEIYPPKLSKSDLNQEKFSGDFSSPVVNQEELKKWSFKNYDEKANESGDEDKMMVEKTKGGGGRRFRSDWFLGLVIAGLIIYGLVYPIISLVIGGMMIKNSLKGAAQAVQVGDFEKATTEVRQAKEAIEESKRLLESLAILKRLGVLSNQLDQSEKLVAIVEEGVSGIDHAVLGSQALFRTTRIISGEINSDPSEDYLLAQSQLGAASAQVAAVKSDLAGINRDNFPDFIRSRIEDLEVKLELFSNLVAKAQVASNLLPEVTGVKGRKSYLVLLENNLELRPAGGFIGSYAKLDFSNGKIANIKVDDIYNLDGGLKEVIEPPADIKNDLGQSRLFLRDSNYEADFPTSAHQAELLYRKESGENINGVVALDLSASASLLNAVGGVDLPEYGEHVSGANLFEKAITHAESNFFPGSQAKKNYLTSLQNQLLSKVFYLSKQNWPAIIEALAISLDQKHLQIYLSDPKMFAYLTSQNWSGVMPRASQPTEGVTDDFLAIVESNMGANKANYYLSRKINLELSITKDFLVMHRLKIDYANNSPSGAFPGGSYKNRIKFYLPIGAKLSKAIYGERDISREIMVFSDYGKNVYSGLVTVNPKDQKSLILEYSLAKELNFKDDQTSLKLTVVKQAGTEADPFNLNLTYPINIEFASEVKEASQKTQEVSILSDLQKDRIFEFALRKK